MNAEVASPIRIALGIVSVVLSSSSEDSLIPTATVDSSSGAMEQCEGAMESEMVGEHSRGYENTALAVGAGSREVGALEKSTCW